MNKDYVIYNLKLANLLINAGFEMVGSGINIQNPKYRVFYFKDTPELRKAVNDIINKRIIWVKDRQS